MVSRTVTAVSAPGQAEPPWQTAAVSWLPGAAMNGMPAVARAANRVLMVTHCRWSGVSQSCTSPLCSTHWRLSCSRWATSQAIRLAVRGSSARPRAGCPARRRTRRWSSGRRPAAAAPPWVPPCAVRCRTVEPSRRRGVVRPAARRPGQVASCSPAMTDGQHAAVTATERPRVVPLDLARHEPSPRPSHRPWSERMPGGHRPASVGLR